MSESGIRLLGISGSPRFESTHYVVNEALKYAHESHGAEVDYFSVRRKTIDFCIHCDYCIRKQQGCVHKDDMAEVYPRMQWAHAWILGSPCYQGQISGQLKSVLDRCRALVAQNPKVFENKIGMGIAVGGDRTGGQEPALHAMIDFYLINEMIPVGGGSFGANLGGSLWSRDKGAEGAGADQDGLASVRRCVDRLIEVARVFHG
ncbi:MAG: flavodoxin family protein [Actinobacteria bacterium]|nr:flavodoxin family protein [Actinomycetota bacterium]